MTTTYDMGVPITERGPAMQMTSGKLVFPLTLRPEDVDINDIAHSLARQCRYTGHIRPDIEHYSVAQHSVLVSKLLPRELALAGLMHDAAEAYTSDISRPMKIMLDAKAPGWRAIEGPIEVAVADHFRLEYPRAKIIKQADLIVTATEKRDVMTHCDEFWGDLPPPLEARIIPLPANLACAAFLIRYHRITKGLA